MAMCGSFPQVGAKLLEAASVGAKFSRFMAPDLRWIFALLSLSYKTETMFGRFVRQAVTPHVGKSYYQLTGKALRASMHTRANRVAGLVDRTLRPNLPRPPLVATRPMCRSRCG
jgi:hypothetical protein